MLIYIQFSIIHYLQMSPTPQTSLLVETFFAVSYRKLALGEWNYFAICFDVAYIPFALYPCQFKPDHVINYILNRDASRGHWIRPSYIYYRIQHCNPVQGQYRARTGFSLWIFPHREKPFFITGNPCSHCRDPCFHYREWVCSVEFFEIS